MWYEVALAMTLVAFTLSSCQTVVTNTPTQMSTAKMNCDPATNRCQTPEFGIKQKARKGQRVSWTMQPAGGWRLTGNPKTTFAGKGVYDVTVTAWDANSLTCQWHAEGDSKLFASDGWVAGYCYADAELIPPPAPVKVRSTKKKR